MTDAGGLQVRSAACLAAILALAVAGSAGARPDANGIPTYVDGYAKWPKLNAKPIRGGSAAHQGTKNVYVSKRKTGARYPLGAIVVKTASPPGKQWLSLVATMRKIRGSANGGWRWEEFTRSSQTARFTKIGFPESGCAACHAQAKSNDYVFTRR
ncbi:MAG: cytochrome P460 family protein [Actinobacteria bacterium]|nr:cytochrome P460 family protein [Actinomycetota bacterium]